MENNRSGFVIGVDMQFIKAIIIGAILTILIYAVVNTYVLQEVREDYSDSMINLTEIQNEFNPNCIEWHCECLEEIGNENT